MPKSENKVKFGLKNVHYAMITQGEDGSITYGTPVAIPGAVNLSLAAQGESAEFYADDILYYATAANTGYQGDLEIARIPDSFRIDVLKEIKDPETGILYENAAAEPAPFALLFEFSGDKNATKHVMYHNTVTRPNVASGTTTNVKEPATDTMTLTAVPRADGIVKCSTTFSTPDATLANWYKAVNVPPDNLLEQGTAPAAPASVDAPAEAASVSTTKSK